MNMPSLHMDIVPFKRESYVVCMDFCSLRCQLLNLNEAVFGGSFFLLALDYPQRYIFLIVFHS